MLSGDCNVCVNGKLPSYSATCVECGLSRKNYKPQTNADRIRVMSDEELAEFLTRYVWHEDDIEGDFLSHLVADTLDWLRQEAEWWLTDTMIWQST